MWLLSSIGPIAIANVYRKIGASKEQARREQMTEEMANGGYGNTQDDEEEDYMEF